MHVLHVIDSLAVGGAERMLVEIANATRDDGHEVSVCVTRSVTTLGADLKPTIPVWVLGRTRRFDLGAMSRLAAQIKESRVDLIHAHGRTTFSFLACVRLLFGVRTPVLLHDHYGMIELDQSIPAAFRWFGRWWLDRYVGVYDRLGQWARDAGVPGERVTVIGNALDLDRIGRCPVVDSREEFGIAGDRVVGVMVGGIRIEKGLHVLIEAVSRCESRESLVLVIVGGVRDPDYLAECRTQIETCGIVEQFRLVGERQDAAGILGGSDFAVISSLSESGPLVLIEALARGVPVVATRVGDIARRAEEAGVEGFVPPGDAGALARALDQLVCLSPADRATRGQEGQSIARERFDVRHAMESWYRVYSEILAERRT